MELPGRRSAVLGESGERVHIVSLLGCILVQVNTVPLSKIGRTPGSLCHRMGSSTSCRLGIIGWIMKGDINHGSPIKHGGRGLVKSHKICFFVTHGG